MSDSELYHFGVPGMKWGVRKKTYKSTNIRARVARRSNDKVDKSFKTWDENSKKKVNAIDLGRKANIAKMEYEKNRGDKAAKSAYKEANKLYKKALSDNTAYRKGAVRQEVGRDLSRKYLSEAKKVKKQLDKDPTNKDLNKKYNDLMSKHDVERANARRAAEVGAKRSKFKANMKRTMTMTVKAAAGAAVVTTGMRAVNRYLNKHEVTLNGKSVQFGERTVSSISSAAKKVRNSMSYLY